MHIPKTGGLVLRNLSKILEEKGLSVFSTFGGRFTEFTDFNFINSHFGITPINIETFDTAVLIREPFDRVISNFTWFMMNNTFDYKSEYKNLSIEQKIKKYLFEDTKSDAHKNLQTKFLTSYVSEEYLNNKYRYFVNNDPLPNIPSEVLGSQQKLYEYNLEIRTRDWFLTNNNFSIEYAKSNLDKCLIIGTTDNHDAFMDKIFNWIKNNWDLDLQEEFKTIVAEKTSESGLPYYNYGLFTDSNGKTYTSADFKSMLTEEEIAQIYADNSLDVELYEYAKAKLQ